MRIATVAVFAALCVMAVPAQAASRDNLAQRIQTLGVWQTKDMRHAVQLKGCRMTIYFWRDWDQRPKVLHSVHHIDMRDWWPLADRPRKRQTGWARLGGGPGHTEVLMIEMRPPARLTSELAKRSNPRPPYQRSARKDVDRFVIKKRQFHGLRFDRMPKPGRMAKLAKLMDRYHRQFCAATG